MGVSLTSTSERVSSPVPGTEQENEMVRRLVWTGLTVTTSALAALLARRASAAIWKRAFNEEPPE
jgi:hypothetical protein